MEVMIIDNSSMKLKNYQYSHYTTVPICMANIQYPVL